MLQKQTEILLQVEGRLEKELQQAQSLLSTVSGENTDSAGRVAALSQDLQSVQQQLARTQELLHEPEATDEEVHVL